MIFFCLHTTKARLGSAWKPPGPLVLTQRSRLQSPLPRGVGGRGQRGDKNSGKVLRPVLTHHLLTSSSCKGGYPGETIQSAASTYLMFGAWAQLYFSLTYDQEGKELGACSGMESGISALSIWATQTILYTNIYRYGYRYIP